MGILRGPGVCDSKYITCKVKFPITVDTVFNQCAS
jgi:hypothetical protein